VVFPDPEARPVLFLQRPDRLLVLGFEADGPADRPALHLGLSDGVGADPVSIGTLYESGSLTFDGSRLEVDLGFRPLLRADYLPGALLACAGLGLAIVALAVGWLTRPALAWIAAASDGTTGTLLHLVQLPHSASPWSIPLSVDPVDPTHPAKSAPPLSRNSRLVFLFLPAILLAGAAMSWRSAGALSDGSLRLNWLAVGVLLGAMGLLAWDLKRQPKTWAAILDLLAAAAILVGLLA
jgi:hypothetical protein